MYYKVIEFFNPAVEGAYDNSAWDFTRMVAEFDSLDDAELEAMQRNQDALREAGGTGCPAFHYSVEEVNGND